MFALGSIVLLALFFTGSGVLAQETYPQVDITGYKQYAFRSFAVSKASSLFQAQTLLGAYYVGGPWQERLKLRINGQLSEKLSVAYDLEQQPDLPDKHNVKVTYDKTDLNFGDFNATFGGNEFTSTTKFLNGVMVTSQDNWYNLVLVPSSKLKSYTQFLATQRGNNTSGPYNLGHSSIIEGSETVELNNVPLSRGLDYSIDYFEGKIKFVRILSPEDEFKYSYEYTNIIDMFFPTVSKRDFIGLRIDSKLSDAPWGSNTVNTERSIRSASEFFPTMLQIKEEKTFNTQEVTVLRNVSTKRSIDETSHYTDVLIGNSVIIRLFDSTIEANEEIATLTASIIKELIENKAPTSEINTKPTDRGYAVFSGNVMVIRADEEQAELQDTLPAKLADIWKNNLINELPVTLETLTVTLTNESEQIQEFEWESTGVYRLRNIPVLPNSEVLTFKGAELKKFEDYMIDYEEGTITLLSPTLPTATEPLRVEYRFVEVASEAEILPGAGFGPYYLSNKKIIPASEIVLVNNIPYVRDLDYVINYDDGSILFATSISSTSNIQIKYRHVVLMSPPAPVSAQAPSEWTIGGTYLQESGKTGAALPTATVMESFSGSTILSRNKAIWLNSRPLSTTEVIVIRNGVIMSSEVDYIIPTIEASTYDVIPDTWLAHRTLRADVSDGLATGTIKYLTTVEATDVISVTYTYYKSSQMNYTVSGSTSQFRYDFAMLRDIVPGTEIIQIWLKNVTNPPPPVILTPNSSIDALDGNYSINYSNPPYVVFNNTSNKLRVNGIDYDMGQIAFKVQFRFVPKSTSSQGDIAHKVYGIDTTYKVGDFNISATVAKSDTDQVYTAVTTNETFHGTGTQEVFFLHSPNKIIDGSEKVIVNTITLNNETQYYFTYDNEHGGEYGSISFNAIKPSTLDVISIDYSYQDTTGLSGKKFLGGMASSITGSMKPLKEVDLSFEQKNVEPNYAPLGGTSIPIGSTYSHVYSKFSPLHNFWISEDYKINKNPIGKSTSRYFLHSYDSSTAGGFNPYGLAQFDFGYRDFNTLDDVRSGEAHATNLQLRTYSLNVTPNSYRYGIFSITNKNDFYRTVTGDRVTTKESTTDFAHTNNSIDITNRARWTLDYQVSKSRALTSESISAPVENKEANDIGSNLNLDLTFPLVKKFSTYFNRQGHNEFDFINKTNKSTINETIHADLQPIETLSTTINHDRQENLTAFTALGNPRNEKTTLTAQLNPHSSTSIGLSRSVDYGVQEAGTKTSGWSNSYTIGHVPISESLYKVTTDYSLNIYSRREPGSLPTYEVDTNTRSFTQNYGITVTPLNALTISSSYIQEDYMNKNNNALSPVDTRSKNQTVNAGTSYRFTSDLDGSINYSRKVTIISTKSPQKIVIDGHVAYKVFVYGTLNYDWTQEDNNGEIISGTFVDQSFLKNIHSLSLDIVLPQTGETILTSVVVKIGYKYANFFDKKNSGNSFEANTLTLEGSLNF